MQPRARMIPNTIPRFGINSSPLKREYDAGIQPGATNENETEKIPID